MFLNTNQMNKILLQTVQFKASAQIEEFVKEKALKLVLDAVNTLQKGPWRQKQKT